MSEVMDTTKAVATASRGGFPILSILTLIFVVGKIMGKLAWSWWWVFAPLWIPTAATIVIGIIAIILMILLAIIAAIVER